jgi:hypothetical protein
LGWFQPGLPAQGSERVGVAQAERAEQVQDVPARGGQLDLQP